MPCHVRNTRTLRQRRKTSPSSLRQVRLLMRLCRRALRIEAACTPPKPSEGSSGQDTR